MQENTTESEKMNEEVASPSATAEGKEKKQKKPYEWTPKRKEAFDKMRKGLEDKITITKKLKEEKRKAEKEAIKAQVRKIMNRKNKEVKESSDSEDSSDSSVASSSSEEKVIIKKKKKHSKEKEKEKSSKSKRPVEDVSKTTEESSESEEERVVPSYHQNVYSNKQHKEYQQSKVERGKAVRRAQFVNPLDQFILL